MIRQYTKKDFSACIEITNAVWDIDKKVTPPNLADYIKIIYVGGGLANSNFKTVYEEDGVVKGFIFGNSGNQAVLTRKLNNSWMNFIFLTELMFLKGISFKRKRFYMKILGEHDQNREKLEPSRKNEVNLFAVAPNTQGKGYGRKLMSAFMEFCQSNDADRIILETDMECNYKFYEHLGFERKGTFFSPFQLEYSQKSGDCFIYEIGLPVESDAQNPSKLFKTNIF